MSKNTYIRYKFYSEDYVSTSYVTGRNAVYNFNRKYSIKSVTDDLINYFEDRELIFEVFGEPADIYEHKSPPSPSSPLSLKSRDASNSTVHEDNIQLKDENQNLLKVQQYL